MTDDVYKALGAKIYDAIYEKYDEAMNDWEYQNGCEILAQDLSTMDNDRECQYFSNGQYLPHNPKNWSRVGQVELDATHTQAESKLTEFSIDTGNKAKDLDVLRACRDYERAEDYGDGWSVIGCIVEIHHGECVIGKSYGACGIDSDLSDGDKADVEKEQILAAFADAKRNRENAVNLSSSPNLSGLPWIEKQQILSIARRNQESVEGLNLSPNLQDVIDELE